MLEHSTLRALELARSRTLIAVLALTCIIGARARAEIGEFEASADVGKVEQAGSAQFDKAAGQYTVKGSGENLWKMVDAFHFLYRKASGDLTLSADIAFVGEGKNTHRKAGWMIRQSLDADAPYVDVMVHGDGLIALQYRSEKGGVTKGIDAKIKAPATVRLERRGDLYRVAVAAKGEAFQSVGEIKVALPDPIYVGLAVCSHDVKTIETAVFSGVQMKNEAAKAEKDK